MFIYNGFRQYVLKFIYFSVFLGLNFLQSVAAAVHDEHKKLASPIAKTITLSQVRKAGENDCAYKSLTHAYSLIDYEVNFDILPSKRALAESNAGRTDGETARIFNIDKQYPNLVRIPVPICHMQTFIYTLRKHKDIKHSDLDNLRVGIVNGSVFVEQEFGKYHTTYTVTNRQLIDLLLHQRVDIIVMTEKTLRQNVTAEQLAKILKLDLYKPTVPLFHYLHKKHKELIPKITETLVSLEKSGFIKNAIKNHQP